MKIDRILFFIILYCCPNVFSQQQRRIITLDNVIDTLSIFSSAAEIEKLNYHSDLLQYENYKKSFLPALLFSLNPVNLNRSLRVLQQPTDGSYSYIEDYSNNSNLGITVRQKIGFIGGELSIGSNINYLKEFSQKRNSFSTTPFTIGYSQQLRGGGKLYRLEKEIESARNFIAVKQYCSKIAQIQQQTLNFYMLALLDKMESELSLKTKLNNDTLLHIAKIKLDNGNITEYDYKQIELQSLNMQYVYENACKNYIESRQQIFTFLGIDDNADITIPNFSLPLTIDPHIATSYVNKNNPFMKQQEIKKMEAGKSFFSVKLNNRFNGNIVLNYGINQYAESFTEAYRHGNTQQSIMIGFQIPVFQWGVNKNRIRIAENSYKASVLAIDNQMREFENEIKKKINNYNHSVKLWSTAEKAYRLSQEQYRMLVRKFTLGKVSVYELTTAQNDQNNAMQRYYSAIKDSYDSYFTLRSLALYDFKRDMELEEIFIKNDKR